MRGGLRHAPAGHRQELDRPRVHERLVAIALLAHARVEPRAAREHVLREQGEARLVAAHDLPRADRIGAAVPSPVEHHVRAVGRHDHALEVGAVGAVGAAAGVIGAAHAPGDPPPGHAQGEDSAPSRLARFLGAAGMLVGGLSALVALSMWMPVWVLQPCMA